jgi:hypothetical protein
MVVHLFGELHFRQGFASLLKQDNSVRVPELATEAINGLQIPFCGRLVPFSLGVIRSINHRSCESFDFADATMRHITSAKEPVS